MAAFIIVLVLIFGGIGLIVWDVNRRNKWTLELKEEVQGHIDSFINTCKDNNISIKGIDFCSATSSTWDLWLQNVTEILRGIYKEKENSFTSAHNLVSEYFLSESSGIGLCAVSKTHFVYQIDFCPEQYHASNNFHTYISSYVRIVEKKEPLDNVKFEDNKHILGYNVECGWNTMSVKEYFELLSAFICSHQKIDYKSIPLSDIIHFRVEGQVEHVSNVSGTGGGVNLQGAVAGGLYFGAAGAIIGSQVGTQTNINTQIVKKDNRKIVLTYTQKGNIKTDTFASENPETTIRVMRQLIPQKEQSISEASPMSDTLKSSIDQLNNAEGEKNKLSQIKELKELLDIGAITQEEFDLKKKELLGL